MTTIRFQPGARRHITPGTNKRTHITIHETGNTAIGANAQAHANLQTRGNPRKASWHYQVDGNEIIQSFQDDVICWHAGNSTGNLTSIGIEICVNADGDYNGAVANAVLLVRNLMARHGIPADRVVQHNHWSGKDCPSRMRSTPGAWEAFQTTIRDATPTPTPAPAPVPVLPSKRKKNTMLRLIPSGFHAAHLVVNPAAAAAVLTIGSPVEATVFDKIIATINAGQPALSVTKDEYDAAKNLFSRD